MGARRAISFDRPNYEEAKKMDASKLRERREQRLGYKVASPRASNPRTDKTSEDRLDHVKRERERARDRWFHSPRQEEDREEAPAAGGFNLQFRKST